MSAGSFRGSLSEFTDFVKAARFSSFAKRNLDAIIAAITCYFDAR